MVVLFLDEPRMPCSHIHARGPTPQQRRGGPRRAGILGQTASNHLHGCGGTESHCLGHVVPAPFQGDPAGCEYTSIATNT